MRVKSGLGVMWKLTVPSNMGDFSMGTGIIGVERGGEKDNVLCVYLGHGKRKRRNGRN